MREYGQYYDSTTAPGDDLVTATKASQVPKLTYTKYDGAGRVTASIFAPKTVERWRNTTVYGATGPT